MRIVVAMDSFKGSLTAAEACEAVAGGLGRALPEAHLILRPMADGGEGTAATVIAAAGGEWDPCRVTGPLPGMDVDAGFVWLAARGPGALVEMAAASGLALLDAAERDPLRTTTFGTGELLRAAAQRGPRVLWLAVGGSATVDGGVGAATVLGWRFLDRSGADIGLGGEALCRIHDIVPPVEVGLPPVVVLCDVTNPLLGPSGAARIFGPQKGAGPDAVERLEEGLSNLVERIRTALGLDLRGLQGAGAAGGLAAGAVAFMGAKLESGVDTLMDVIGLPDAVAGADWVITGEGRFDRQSLAGKVVSGVARVACESGARVAVLAGSVEPGVEADSLGIDEVEAAAPAGVDPDEAMAQGADLLAAAATRLAERL
ncbi:MAG: glycerate kinase [Gemmatimonadetes bacterium]|nr:glycerate kinase [Gemmatimonadota bacterium]